MGGRVFYVGVSVWGVQIYNTKPQYGRMPKEWVFLFMMLAHQKRYVIEMSHINNSELTFIPLTTVKQP